MINSEGSEMRHMWGSKLSRPLSLAMLSPGKPPHPSRPARFVEAVQQLRPLLPQRGGPNPGSLILLFAIANTSEI